MQSGKAHVIVGAIHGDVLVLELVEGCHELLEVLLATLLAHELGREVAVHAGAVPVDIGAEGLAVVVHIDAVLLANALKHIAGEPDLVGGFLGALAEDLEFPLALGHFGIDALVVDAHLEADVEVLLDDVAGDVADIGEADAAIELALTLGREATLGEAERCAVLVEEVLLLETEPGVGIVENGGAGVGRMRLAVREEDLAHDEESVLAGRIRIAGDGLEEAIGALAFGLTGGAAVESPHREILQCGEFCEFLDLGLASEVGNGLVSVEPDVFEFVLGHDVGWFVMSCCLFLISRRRADRRRSWLRPTLESACMGSSNFDAKRRNSSEKRNFE